MHVEATHPAKPLIKINGLKQYFPVRGKRGQYVKANDGIDLTIYQGETFGLVGESGCGKSTLGRSLLQLYKPTAGTVTYYGRDEAGIELTTQPYKTMRHLRRDLQLIFQDPYSSLNPRMTVGQIIGEGLRTHGFFEKNDPRLQESVMKIMEECGLSPYMIHRFPHQFSGGQRQRIGIARSLAVHPKFVVCDEAVSALDVSIQSQILNLLRHLKEKERLTYLFISHDLSVIKYISDRVGVMYLGNIVELAPSAELYAHPVHPYSEALLSAIPTTDADQPRDPILLEGDIPSPINPPAGCKFHTRCRYCEDICRKEIPVTHLAGKDHYVACHVRAPRDLAADAG